MKKWRQYERLVALLTSGEYDSEYTVIPNIRMNGFISGRKRQIDILVECRFDSDLNRRIVFDAKLRNRPIDIKEVESFEGLMKDVNAQRGFIVCSNGYTKSALRRSEEHIGIRLIPADQLDDFSIHTWDRCMNEKCNDGLVLWDSNPSVILNDMISVQSTGKCDVCGKFHVWCWDCGNKHFLGDEDEWQCSCKGPWFWLSSTEPELDKSKSYKARYLILVLGNGQYHIVDRRPI
jgi:hypothetical protein